MPTPTYYIVSFRRASGNPREVLYLCEFPTLIKTGKYAGKYNEYGLACKAHQAFRFPSRQLATWHAKRRARWAPTVIAYNPNKALVTLDPKD